MLPFATRLAILFFASYTVFAQTDAPVPAAAAGVLLVKLSPPVYPPLARQARIMADVRIQLAIRRDGSVESSEVVSGHPLLKRAALESAQQSKFECRSCSDEVNSYSLNYTFGLGDDNAGRPVVDKRRVRSLKCLYLEVRCAADLHLAATDQYCSRSDSLSESRDDSCVYGLCGNLIFLFY